MLPDRWLEIERAFHQALGAPADAREATLHEACGDDEDLLREVRDLLATAADAEAYFDQPSRLPTVLAAAAEDAQRIEAEDQIAGTRVGPWQVGPEIGRGGMGAVFNAERADGLYAQAVALKVVKRGMDTDAIVRRFRRERAVLAGLDHPGIARLLDGGTTPDGRPYFAMERVDGTPLTDYADGQRLAVDARLRLFLQACAAVSYAHRRLIVHRDLKPSNVLVARADDGAPRVKLLDFGVAKLLDSDDPATTRTGDADRPLTPGYAAPEQYVDGPVTTATDVYALGVVLHELLTGRRPPAPGARDTAAQVRPSTVAGQAEGPTRRGAPPAPPAAVAARRSTTPKRLRHRLRGDLDTLVLRALHADPDRRYPTVDALAGDVERHLAGLPIMARPDRWAYRATKFVGRYRRVLAVAAAVAVALGGLGAHSLREGRRAEVAREQAQAASAFVLDLLAEADPREGAGGATPIRDVLGRAAQQAEAELAGRPDLLAPVLTTVGRTLTELGEFERAESPLRRAVAVASGDGPTAEARLALGGWARLQGRYDEAELLLTGAVDAAATGHPTADGDLLRARTLAGRAALDADRGRFREAASRYRAALTALRRAFPQGHRQTALTLAQLGSVLSDLGRLGDSARALRKAAALQRRLLGPAHPELAMTWASLGNTLELRDSLDASSDAHRRALATFRAAYGEDHPMMALALHNLASVEDARGRSAEAARLYRQALATKHRLYGDVHGSVAATLINLGYLQYEQGDSAAEATTREALRVSRAAYGDAHYRTAIAAYNLAEILLEARRGLAEAEGLLVEALATDRATYGPDDEGALLTQLLLGRVQAARGAYERARPTLRDGLAALGDRLGGSAERTAAAAALGACGAPR